VNDRKHIFESLVEYLNTLDETPYNFTEDTVLAQANISSIGFVKLLIIAETKFDIVFSDEDLLITSDITINKLIDKIMILQEKQIK